MIKATNHDAAMEMITSAAARKIELAYDISADEFFQLATILCRVGDKIVKEEKHFVISLKGEYIPPND
ncbi:hypothetical protein ACX6VP_001449 [Yersinia enterocolitica]